jgi:oligopeptide transport system substrate-binding protein
LKKFLYIFILVTVLPILIGGCVQTVSTSPGVSSGSVLNLASIDPITLDPATVGDATSHTYVGQIFSGLLKLDSDMQPIPDMAEGMPSLTADGLTYTFKLKNNLKFQNGDPVNAGDFKYSWERAASLSSASQTAGAYLGDIVGVKEMLAGNASSVSGVKVVDNLTLQVTIDSPKSYFLYKLTYPTSFVVEKSTVAGNPAWWQSPQTCIGTGPFRLAGWIRNTSLTLERNNYYYSSLPLLKQVKYQFYSGIPMDLYETGQIDATDVTLPYIDKVMDRAGPFYSDFSSGPELSFGFVGFNCALPPFDDAGVRRAFSLAVDKDKLVSLVYRNMVQRADGILPPGMPGYNQNLKGLKFDPVQAVELIKTSKYGDVSNLPQITLTTSGYGGAVGSTIQALVYEWKQNLGVDVHVRQLEPERFLYSLKTELDQMYDMGWIADYPHPQDFIDILFRSGADNNYGNYSNSVVDALIFRANESLDQNQSFSLYQQAEQQIVSDSACIPLSFGKNYTLAKNYVQAYEVNPLGVVDMEKVSIKPH